MREPCNFKKKVYAYILNKEPFYYALFTRIYMNKKHIVTLALTAIFTHSILCMHTLKRSVTQSHNRNYIITTKPCNIEQGRRDAYQKWCATRIDWNNKRAYQQLPQNSNYSHQDAMAYFKQFYKI